MRTETKLTEAEAIALLDRVLARAEQLNAETRVMREALALRVETFIAILKANPDLVKWTKQRDLTHRPMYRSYCIVITGQSMESPEFRSGALQ